jgi:hypothetical protein
MGNNVECNNAEWVIMLNGKKFKLENRVEYNKRRMGYNVEFIKYL